MPGLTLEDILMDQSIVTKGKKDRVCARARRRARKNRCANADTNSVSGLTPTQPTPVKSSRWVRVSSSCTARRLEGTEILGEDGADSEVRQDHAQTSQHSLASPSTPSRHVQPVALFSPAIFSGTLSQQPAPLSTSSDDSIKLIPRKPQERTGMRASHVHDWVCKRAFGREGFQTDNTVDGAVAQSLTEQSEAISTTGYDPVEGAYELWVTMGPTAFWLDPPELFDSSAGFSWDNEQMRSGEGLLSDENEIDVAERKRWQEWAKHAAEHERQRRMKILDTMDLEEQRERMARRAWALSAMDEEQRRRGSQEFLLSIQDSSWFQGTISAVDLDYEIVCPNTILGCSHSCFRSELEKHLAEGCRFNKEPEDADSMSSVDAGGYEVVCPNTILGCDHSCGLDRLGHHLEHCYFTGPDITEEKAERAKTKEMVLEQTEEERERRVNQGDWRSDSLLHRLCTLQKKTALVILHKEILDYAASGHTPGYLRGPPLVFQYYPRQRCIGKPAQIRDFDARCRDIQERRKKALEGFWRYMENVICALWPDTLIFPFGSFAISGLMTPDSDIDMMVFPGDQRECRASRPSADMSDEQARRRGSRTDSLGAVTSRIHELADHLQQHANLSCMKVIHHARVPVIKAEAFWRSGSDDEICFNIDISIDGPTHSGLATSAFASYLSDHLPNLAPLTIVLKTLLQSKGLNDPFTGGISSYGLILMVAFALLQRDHFPPSPSGSSFIQQPSPRPTPDEGQAEAEKPDAVRPRTLSSPDNKDVAVSPSPEPSLKIKSREGPTRKKLGPSVGRRRFWQRSTLAGDSLKGTGSMRAARELKAPGSMSSWDRPRQQQWLGSRTARAVLMQDFYAGAPVPAATQRGQACDNRDGSTSSVPPPPPPPLPEPAAESASHVMAPPSPYISTGEKPVLGELLLDFLHLFGEDFDSGTEGFTVRGGGFRFCVHGHPPHPQAGDPIVIEDPLNCMNNVGRSSFGIGQVQKRFVEALATLKAIMVRINQDGREVLGTNTGILPHICAAAAAKSSNDGP